MRRRELAVLGKNENLFESHFHIMTFVRLQDIFIEYLLVEICVVDARFVIHFR